MLDVMEEALEPRTETTDTVEVQRKKDSEDTSGSSSSLFFKLNAFEGPLDLLLHLIREHKIDIYDIPIVEITRQYMGYIDLMKELNLEIAGDYLVMAATLIHIKSRMLLPVEEEKSDDPEEDPRAELVRRLLEYKSYKESSVDLRKREDVWKHVFSRTITETGEAEFDDEPVLMEASVFDLIAAFQKLLEKAPEQIREISRESLTVTDRINFVVERLENSDGMRFEDLFEHGYTRVMLIVTFLAMLEIIRLGLARIYQEREFGTIWLLNPDADMSVTCRALVPACAGYSLVPVN